MNLYLVMVEEDEEIEVNLDLFVSAKTPTSALDLWRKWAEGYIGREPPPGRVFLAPQVADEERIHPWYDPAPNGVQRIKP